MSNPIAKLGRPFVFLFKQIAEPRVLRFAQSLVYLVLMVAGINTLMSPLPQWLLIINHSGVQAFGWFLCVGGLLGAIGAIKGPKWWWSERAGIASLAVALVIRAILIASLGASFAVGMIFLALVFEIIVYYLFVRKTPFIPAWR